jgi:hypothetical protein
MWLASKLNYTYQDFQEGIIGINSSSFGPLNRPAKNQIKIPLVVGFFFHTSNSNEYILSFEYQN